MEMSKMTRLTLVAAAAGAATTAVVSTAIDMANFEGVMFFGNVATGAANNIVKAQQGLLADGSDAADLTGTANAITANNNQFLVDIYRPRERYVRVSLARGTSTASGEIYALQYGPRVQPTTQASTVKLESFVSPAEGTA
jgi:hypothetical protein